MLISRFASWFVALTLVAACGSANEAIDAGATTATVSISKMGSGTVTSSPDGISCGATCSQAFAAGTSVTLTAVADAGFTFTGWIGGGCTGTAACSFDVLVDTQISAVFVAHNTLLVVPAGNGEGTVTSTPAGIDCGADCSEQFSPDTTVTLTATPSIGSTFTGWSGGGCTGTGTCVLTITEAVMVMPTFTLEQHALTVTPAGNGAGVVTATGIDCGTDCTENIDYGTEVTLTATPSTGSVFTGWSGAGCTGTATCITTVTAATNVTATFTLTTHTLTITRSGNGTGTVTSNPAGITCGATCMATYNYGATIILTAAPDVGSAFAGWTGGGCSGTGTCTTTIQAATTVDAMFTLTQHTLAVDKAGNATGTVTSTPSGISCGADCSEVYNYGTAVLLTATATTGTFSGWSGGGCSGIGTCAVTVTQATTVTATFTTGCTGTQTFSYTGAAQSFVVPTCAAQLTIDAYGAQGGTGGNPGGMGGRAVGSLAVTPGETLVVMVGGMGITAPTTGSLAGFAGGFNGGGGVHEYTTWTGQSEGLSGTGGGATDVRRGGSALVHRVIVAGGGGGGASLSGLVGGIGGGLVGGNAPSGTFGGNYLGAGGGTQTAGGTTGSCCANYPNTPGSLGVGGEAYRDASGSGGGGGGYYGGGGGQFAGGGGGSSYIGGLSVAATTAGVRAGHGTVTISW